MILMINFMVSMIKLHGLNDKLHGLIENNP